VTDTHAIVNLAAIRRNVKTLSDFANQPALVPIKANAYGHGAVQVARALEPEAHVVGFAVATPSEALELRAAGLTKAVLLLTPAPPERLAALVHNGVSFVVSSVWELEVIAAEALAQGVKARVHLKINTGLNRLGASADEGDRALAKLTQTSSLELFGIMTHLVDSEDVPAEHASRQIERFQHFLQKHRVDVPYRHAANTGGILNRALNAHFDLVRPGIGSYGYAPGTDCEGMVRLEPAMELRSWVIQVKPLAAGEPVSYNAIWSASQDTRVATLRLGYADGYPRALSSKASVLIHGQIKPQVGRVCMDQLVVDIGDLEAEVGNSVMIFGDGAITAQHVANWAGTNAYEILTSVGARVPRVYNQDGVTE
jgi:alanine racemase